MAEDTNPDTRYQPEHIAPRLVLFLLGSFAALLASVLLGLALFVPSALHEPMAGASQALPPQPRLELDERRALAEVRAEEEERLHSYGWVDRAHGIVHIPIEEAMRRTAEQGIATWPGR